MKPTPTKPPRLPKGRVITPKRYKFTSDSKDSWASFGVTGFDADDGVTRALAILPCKSAREAKAVVKLHADRKALLDVVPSNWLDPMLTGPDAVLSKKAGSWNCHDIERLMFAVRERLAAKLEGRP
jgi:hypothetical protein